MTALLNSGYNAAAWGFNTSLAAIDTMRLTLKKPAGIDTGLTLVAHLSDLIGQSGQAFTKVCSRTWNIQHVTRLPGDITAVFIDGPTNLQKGNYTKVAACVAILASRFLFVAAWLANHGLSPAAYVAGKLGMATIISTSAMMNLSLISVTVGVVALYSLSMRELPGRINRAIAGSNNPKPSFADCLKACSRELTRVPAEILDAAFLVQASAQILFPQASWVIGCRALSLLGVAAESFKLIDMFNDPKQKIVRGKV